MFYELFSLFVLLILCNSLSVLLIYLLHCLTYIVFLVKLPFHKTQPLGARLLKGLVDIQRCGPPDFPARYAPPVRGKLPGGSSIRIEQKDV